MAQPVIIFHKTTCSTSRNVLDALRKGKVEPEIRDYISNPPDAEELKGILKKLKLPAEALVRKKEALYKEKYEGKKLSESAWIKILCQNPVLIERPIVISGRKAVLCRPPERWKEILKK